MMRTIKEWIKKVIPQKILSRFFHSKATMAPVFENRFIELQDTIAQKPFYMYLREDTWIETQFLESGLYGNWEKVSLQLWACLSKNAGVIVDIGANTGCYSLLAQNNNPLATVIAVEPIDVNFKILSKNIAQNHFPIYTEKVALSSEEGTATMYMLKDKLNYMTSVNDDRYAIYPEVKGKDDEVVPIQVPIKTFGYIVNKHDLKSIDLVKLDVEGHELSVLTSMEPYLKQYHPSILIEISGDENAIELDKFLKKIGYQTFISINEKAGLKIEDKVWDNHHANFLICQQEVVGQIPKELFLN